MTKIGSFSSLNFKGLFVSSYSTGKFKTSPPILTRELVNLLNNDDKKTDKKNANIGDRLRIVVAMYSLS